jgi:hypothetical protein
MSPARSLAAAWTQRMELFPMSIDRPWISVAAAIATYVIAVTLMRPRWRRAVERGLPHVYLFMPDTREERRWWIAVSICAGISEEITWRGVQPALVAFVAGSPEAGAVIAAAQTMEHQLRLLAKVMAKPAPVPTLDTAVAGLITDGLKTHRMKLTGTALRGYDGHVDITARAAN